MKMKASHFFAVSGATLTYDTASHPTRPESSALTAVRMSNFATEFLLFKVWFPFSVGIWISVSVQDTA